MDVWNSEYVLSCRSVQQFGLQLGKASTNKHMHASLQKALSAVLPFAAKVNSGK